MAARTSSPPYAKLVDDLSGVLSTLQAQPALGRALIDPSFPVSGKLSLLSEVFPDLDPAAIALLQPGLEQGWGRAKAMLGWLEDTQVTTAWQWAEETGVLDRAIDEVFAFGRLVAEDVAIRAALTDRKVPTSSRQDLAAKMLEETMTPAAVQIARAIVASRRGTIDAMVRAFIELGVKQADAQLAVATVAKPLTGAQKKQLANGLEARLGAKIVVQEIVDPAVLGGVRVECGAEVIDSTMAMRLESVRREFA
ncbi:MAG: ATP synthase F1 subunit delta [Propionibacteriaceae bacterium]|jgi:F-type H+-transporting ATPase subunit delta|nr:ATP synthase F1 subunit delta [Propionibacteriaceae bacterium]